MMDELINACVWGNTDLLRSLVKKGISVNIDCSGFLPLSLAVQVGHLQFAETLIELGAHINAQDSKCRNTALHHACIKGSIEMVKLLLNHGAQVNLKDDTGCSALIDACVYGHTNIVLCLLSHGADLELSNDQGMTPFMYASMSGHTNLSKILIDHGAKIETCKVSALVGASGRGHTETVKLLLDHGAELEARNDEGASALYSASKYGHTETLRILLDHGAQVDAKDNSGKTALIIASLSGHTETVQVLLDHGAHVNAEENNGMTALVRASLSGHTETVRVLLDNNARANSQEGTLSALSLASWTKNTEILQLLIERTCQADPVAAQKALENHGKASQLSFFSEDEAAMSDREVDIDPSHPYYKIEEMVSTQDKLVEKISEFQRFAASSDETSQLPENLTLMTVFKELIPLASNWQKIGTWLNLSFDEISRIGNKNHNRERDCLRELLEEWLKRIDPLPSWEQLANAVKQVDLKKAEDIRSKYLS